LNFKIVLAIVIGDYIQLLIKKQKNLILFLFFHANLLGTLTEKMNATTFLMFGKCTSKL